MSATVKELAYHHYEYKGKAKMGAWGVGTFDNDDAADWTYELEATPGDTLLVESLTYVVELGEDFLDSPEACRALAAAEVVAALRGEPATDLPEIVRNWVAQATGNDIEFLAKLSLQAIERIEVDSELKELWDETNDAAEWYEGVANLKTRLSA